ncbi:MAG: short-chain dehydrogenase [Leptospiraceae bacterium]|nr:short-chain dehydrogenase [Leptospiraceae bacterium]
MKIEGKVVMITGAVRGIGRGLVDAFLKAGANRVYAASRNLEAYSHPDKRVIPLQLDVTNQESIQSAVKMAGDTQILVNNAGVLEFGNLLEADRDSFRRNLEVNLWGNLDMDRAFVPVLARNGEAAVVNILTLLSMVSAPGMSAYNASKAAAWSLGMSLRATLASQSIPVFNVFPGAVDTDMLAGVEMTKTPPAIVAAAIVEGLKAGTEDIFPDPMSQTVYDGWKKDHKAVEKQFASM